MWWDASILFHPLYWWWLNKCSKIEIRPTRTQQKQANIIVTFSMTSKNAFKKNMIQTVRMTKNEHNISEWLYYNCEGICNAIWKNEPTQNAVTQIKFNIENRTHTHKIRNQINKYKME